MINDGEDGVEQVDLIDDGNIEDALISEEPVQEYAKVFKMSSASAAVESTQAQFGSQGHPTKFPFTAPRYNNREQAD